MKLEKYALMAEIFSAVAVVVTLIVLIQQVHANTAAIERQSLDERAARLVEPYLDSPMIREVYVKMKEKDGGTEPAVEAFKKTYGFTTEESVLWVRHLEWIWLGFEADYLATGPSDNFDRQLRDFLSYPDEQLFWKNRGAFYSTDFVDYVNSLTAGQ